jgi:hypothetical protein
MTSIASASAAAVDSKELMKCLFIDLVYNSDMWYEWIDTTMNTTTGTL